MANSAENRNAVMDVDLSHGMDVDSLEKANPSWIQNVLFRCNRLEVREGFGTLAQFGSTLNAGRADQALPAYGYGPPLGAVLQITNAGHVQLLSLHRLAAFTGTLTGQNLSNLFALSVFDVTTGRRAEHVFRGQTQWQSNLPAIALPSAAQPAWLERPPISAPSFAQLADLQYMCLPGQGVWFYRPIDVYAVDQRLQTVPGTLQQGDDAWLEELRPSDGIFTDAGNVYFNAATFPPPQCLAVFQNRMVYASARKLYFSDADRPDNVLGDSFYPVPTEMPITAVTSNKGVILAFTAEETWLYQPSSPTQTGLISGGNIYNLSRSRGCLTPQSMCLMGDLVVFMDRRGIYTNDGSTTITKISDPIDSWFSLPEQIQNPLTNYLTQNGMGTTAAKQPRAFIDFAGQLERATMAWDSQNSLLYITLADLSLVYSPDFGWSVYLYETTAVPLVGGNPKVGIQQQILNPIMLCHGGDTFMVGGADVATYPNGSQPNIDDSSVYILELGRGGGLDRSSVSQEDERQPYQGWTALVVDSTHPNFWVAPPILLPSGFKTSNQTTTKPTWLVPVYAATTTDLPAVPVASLAATLQFNATDWQPLLIGAGPAYDYILPPNRVRSAAAFTDMRVHDAFGPNAAGDRINIHWDSTGFSTADWTAWPAMALNPTLPQPICYLLMQRRTGTEATTCASMGWNPLGATLNPAGAGVSCNVYAAQESGQPAYPEQDLGDNTQAQPVDWAITTPLVGDGKAQYKARGVFATVQHYGDAQTRQVPGWPIAAYGTVTTSDFKDFSAQQVDWQNGDPNEIEAIGAPRFRIQAAAATQPSAKVGTTDPTNPNVPRWSDTAAWQFGNLLVDDAAVDTIATSEGVRGERFRSMLFGCINANGEAVKVSKVRILTRMVGGLRRTGRRGLT